MVALFNTILYQPLFNLLIWLYNVVPGHDIGVAIILLTIIIKLILYPFAHQSIKSQKAMQDIQPHMEEIKIKYKDKKDEQAKAMMQLYKDHKVNPFSSCLPLLIQLPFLIAVYQVFRNGLKSTSLDMLYPFIHNPGTINTMFLGFIDMNKPNLVLAVLAGLAQFWQAKTLMAKQPAKAPSADGKDASMTSIMNKQMLYFLPIMTVVIGATLPGGLALYWLVITLLTALQQWHFLNANKSELQANKS